MPPTKDGNAHGNPLLILPQEGAQFQTPSEASSAQNGLRVGVETERRSLSSAAYSLAFGSQIGHVVRHRYSPSWMSIFASCFQSSREVLRCSLSRSLRLLASRRSP